MIKYLVIEDCDFHDTQFRDSPHMLCRKDNKTQSIPMVTPHMLLIFIQMAEVWAVAKVYHIIGFHHTHAEQRVVSVVQGRWKSFS